MKHLRELAKDFAQGKITQDDYRKQRAELIKGIMAGEIDVPDREFLAPLAPTEDSEITAQGYEYDPGSTTEIAVTKPGKKSKSSAAKPATPPPPARKPFPVWLFVSLSVAVLVLIVALTALFIFTSDEETATTNGRVVNELPAAGEAASTLIKLFIQQNNWQQENLNKFQQNWQKIGTTEQQAAAQLPIMNQLKNAIYKKILEERAMIDLGDAESARQKQQVLVDFAQSVGITDPSISVDP